MADERSDRVRPYLDEIADRLWSNSAAVMVGAGFSRNAEPTGSASIPFPSWNVLGDLFYRKLHGRAPGNEVRYLSLLKLADQVQAAFGRPALNDLLRKAIPDLRYEPSQLHNDLLDLPWKDVFTTNYDTLLERARASVRLKRYDVVVKKEDLLYANAPRIVKLHGSFPSSPFVITEEDYRRYPTDHAPFVNTVRQSLLENTLCLIGFSGDDPNFLQWIGWIRDQVGRENAPKIYLVGVLDGLSEADRKLLDGRGIVAVDLSVFAAEPDAALSFFLDYLADRKTRAPYWPPISEDARRWAADDSSEKYRDVVAEWAKQRAVYPGWVVVPEDRRGVLWHYTEDWLFHIERLTAADCAGLEPPLDLEVAFELGWRLDRCLWPLVPELSAFLEGVAARYSEGELQIRDIGSWTRDSVFEAVANIRLWLLRYYREEGLEANWQKVRQSLELDFDRLFPEQRARFRLEEALQALFRFDPAEAKRLLTEWQSNESLPFWEAKRAALMAELGDGAAARSILESSLSAIREQLGLNPVVEDYTLVSQESVVMLLLWAVEHGMRWTEPDSGDGNLMDELSERWNELARYKCDPRREMQSLSARLGHPAVGARRESTTHHFDLGVVSRNFRVGSDKELIAAYSVLRLYEDVGIPYRIHNTVFVNDAVKATLPRVGHHSPHWALVNIVRLGDAKGADWLFDRQYLARLGRDEVDRYFEIYLPTLERTITMVDEPDWSEARTFESLAKTLPEVFSRLCYKCSPACRERLAGILGAIYGSKRRHLFAEVGSFARRLFDSMSVNERASAVPSLIEYPMPDGLEDIDKRKFANPVLLVKLPASLSQNALGVSEERIDQLLDRLAGVGSERDWAATSLAWLHDHGQLNELQSERLGTLLWEAVEDSEVPLIPGVCSFACVTLPHPAYINPEPRAKERLRSMVAERKGDGRFDDVLEELTDSASVIKWEKAEALELFEELSGWWDNNKYRLVYTNPMPFGSRADNTRRTTAKIINALTAIFLRAPTVGHGNFVREQLRRFIAELEQHGIPAARLEAATVGTLSEGREDVRDRVAFALLDSRDDRVIDAVAATGVLAQMLVEERTREHFDVVGAKLVQGVEWRHGPGLAQRLRLTADLIESQPWFLSREAETGLLAGLDQIAEETSTGVRGNDKDGVIPIRASAASVAFALFRHYHEDEVGEPETIRRWRALCGNPDEFSEVGNAWGSVEA